VKNIEMLVQTLKEPKPPHLEEDLYVSGTSDSLYGSWQG
jgi:hypothetical protein